jgi:hypothetical protein
MTDEWLHRIEKILWPRGERRDVWMILDAARGSRVFSMLLECRLDYVCLYRGPLHPEIELAAPYLVQLDYEYRHTRRLLKEAWGRSWGVFLRSDTRIERLRRHLRTLLLVRDSTGRQLLFRYYDPRVLRVYLPTCTPMELETVYGPIQRFWAENKTSDSLLEFELSRAGLAPKRHLLASGECSELGVAEMRSSLDC